MSATQLQSLAAIRSLIQVLACRLAVENGYEILDIKDRALLVRCGDRTLLIGAQEVD